MPNQIRFFAAMFLDEPHRAGRYYGTLLRAIGGRIFSSDHNPMPYYTSAFAHYRLESLFRNTSLPTRFKPFRYQLLMLFRYIAGGKSMPHLNSGRIESYCNKILEVLWDETRSLETYNTAAGFIESTAGASVARDTIKTQSFTELLKAPLVRES